MRTQALLLLLPLLLLSACGKPAPSPAPSAGRGAAGKAPKAYRVAVSRAATATDAASVKYFLDAVKDSTDATSLPDSDAARKRFPQARFPRETLGRKLLVITYAGDANDLTVARTLTLIYEGGLTVNETVFDKGKPLSMPRPEGADSATIGTDPGMFSTYDGGPKNPRLARLEWKSGDVYCVIDCPGATKEQLVAVGRSMAP